MATWRHEHFQCVMEFKRVKDSGLRYFTPVFRHTTLQFLNKKVPLLANATIMTLRTEIRFKKAGTLTLDELTTKRLRWETSDKKQTSFQAGVENAEARSAARCPLKLFVHQCTAPESGKARSP
jgi:hypothetical protein